jgi:hypothetical protein
MSAFHPIATKARTFQIGIFVPQADIPSAVALSRNAVID